MSARNAAPASADTVLAALAAQGVVAGRLTADSRSVRAGDVFVAYPGESADGRRFIGAAIQDGARAVLAEHDGLAWDSAWTVPHVAVKGLKQLAGPIAHEVYGRPSEHLTMIGVTGTNGKTSTAQWIAQALRAHASAKVGVIGTLGIGYAGEQTFSENPNTTPDAIVLQASLAQFVAAGTHAVSMEVSSIGLDQGRVAGVQFDCAVFTNLSRDHLDYHGDMASYTQVKMRFFEFPSLTFAVLNLDDVVGVRIAQALRGRKVHRIGYSASGTAALFDVEELLIARNITYRDGGLAFDIVGSGGAATVSTPFVGAFNVANLLAVAGALMSTGLPLARAVELLGQLEPVAGRMQTVRSPQQAADAPSVIVDYAHTPDALEKVLLAGRELARARAGRLIAVFGCGGDRDRGKRAQMGALAMRLADVVIVTSDNPRSESPAAIIADIVAGMSASGAQIEPDRRTAIAMAIGQAGADDTVVLAGKGHEPYQEIAGVRQPFSDVEEATRALATWTVH